MTRAGPGRVCIAASSHDPLILDAGGADHNARKDGLLVPECRGFSPPRMRGSRRLHPLRARGRYLWKSTGQEALGGVTSTSPDRNA